MRRYLALVLAVLVAVVVVYVIGAAGGARQPKRGAARPAVASQEPTAPPPSTTTMATQTRTATQTTTVVTATRTDCRWRMYHDGAIGADPGCAPGEIDSAVPGHTAQTICNAAWLANANRLQASLETKDQLLIEYSLPGSPVTYVAARVIPVEDGGSPTSPLNLYPLPLNGWGGQETRALVAGELHEEICAHETTVAEAAKLLAGDWLAKGLPDDD